MCPFICIVYIMIFPTLGLPESIASTSKPASATRPAGTRPAVAELPERELNEQEKKAFNAGLLEARTDRLIGAEALQRKIRVALAEAKKRRSENADAAIKEMNRSENNADRARDRETRNSPGYYNGTSRNGHQRQARQAKKDLESAQDKFEEEQAKLSNDLKHLQTIENIYIASRETRVHLEFGQLKKAYLSYKKATIAHRRLVEVLTPTLQFAPLWSSLVSAAQREYQNIHLPEQIESEEVKNKHPIKDDSIKRVGAGS